MEAPSRWPAAAEAAMRFLQGATARGDLGLTSFDRWALVEDDSEQHEDGDVTVAVVASVVNPEAGFMPVTVTLRVRMREHEPGQWQPAEVESTRLAPDPSPNTSES